MTRPRFPIRDPDTGEEFFDCRWHEPDQYEAAADREAESRRDMEFEDGEDDE